MLGELQLQRVAGDVMVQRRVVAHGGALAVDMGAAVDHLRQIGPIHPGLGQDELGMVVKARADKACQLGAAHGQADKAGAELLARQQLYMARAEFVAYTLHDGHCLGVGHDFH